MTALVIIETIIGARMDCGDENSNVTCSTKEEYKLDVIHHTDSIAFHLAASLQTFFESIR